MPGATDAELVERVVNGDTESFAELIRRYEEKLFRYVLYLTHDTTLSEDIVQDTFIKAYQNLQSYNPKYSFSSWVYRIAHNGAMDSFRKSRHIADGVEVDSLEQASDEMNIVQSIDREILHDDVQECLEELEAKYREVLMLQYYENMRFSDIADVLHIPVSTVGVWSSRGKTRLRKLCEKKGVKP
jgi:RNA polymerase sigma-70 factor (ECF subfamily)